MVSCSSESIEDFAALAEELSVPDVDVIEANISCPTRNSTGGNFAMHEDYTRDCIQAIRAKTKLSQAKFAAKLRVPVATVRDWEQHRRSPDAPARTLLGIVDADPKAAMALIDRAI